MTEFAEEEFALVLLQPEILGDIPLAVTDGEEAGYSELFEALEPTPDIWPVEWGEAYVELGTETSNKVGRWKARFTPYMIEPMNSCRPGSGVNRLVTIKGAQLGFTQGFLIVMAYLMDLYPCPIGFFLQSRDALTKVIEQKLIHLLGMERIKRRIMAAADAGLSKGARVSEKRIAYQGGAVYLGSLESVADIRSVSMKAVFLDDVDGARLHQREGNQALNAEGRTDAFGDDYLIVYNSTPARASESIVSPLYDDSTERKYMAECQGCKRLAPLELKFLMWLHEDGELLDLGAKRPRGTALEGVYVCPICSHIHRDRDKERMLVDRTQGGRSYWHSPHCSAPDTCDLHNRCKTCKGFKTEGYQISSLYSRFYSWTRMAGDYETGLKDPSAMVSFMLTKMGVAVKDVLDTPSHTRLFELRSDYSSDGEIPKDALTLFAGIDVQEGYTVMDVWGYGQDERRWFILRKVFKGETDNIASCVWTDMSKFLRDTWFDHEGGGQLQIKCAAVDSGYNSDVVYEWGHQHSQGLIVVDGIQKEPRILGKCNTMDIRSSRSGLIRNGVLKWAVGVDQAKTALYGFLARKIANADEKDQMIFFPCDVSQDWIKELVSEERVKTTNVKTGREVTGWQGRKTGGFRRHEAMDNHNYAWAAARFVGIHRWTAEQWEDERITTLRKTFAEPPNELDPRDDYY